MKEVMRVMLVDDDQEDVSLMLDMIKESDIDVDVDVSNNGQDAYEILKTRIKNNQKLPHLILLDLNMPKKNGHELLEDLKSDNKLKLIPVIILTSSKSDTDIEISYTHGASCYVTKPVGLIEFQKILLSINNFWFSVVKYPNN